MNKRSLEALEEEEQEPIKKRMKTTSGVVESIAELKDHVYDLVDAKEAYKYEETTKKIGNYVGRVYNHHMRLLVSSGIEQALEKPEYPTGSDASDEKKAVWSKDYDQYLKKRDVYEEYKAKVFVIILGRCTKAMKNRIEEQVGFKGIESSSNVIELLKMIKKLVFDANEKKHPSLRSVLALKKLCTSK